MTAAALSPAYPFTEPGHEVVIHDGPVEVVGVDRASGRVLVTTIASLRVKWQVEIPHGIPLGPATLRLERPDLGTVEVDAFANHLVDHIGGGRLIKEASLSRGAPLTRVVASWVNLPRIWSRDDPPGRWTAEGGGWRLTLQARPDLQQTLDAVTDPTRFSVTHCGELTRSDGSSFDPDVAKDALFGWQMALSFALGRWAAPALPVGYSADGTRAWEQWMDWRCDQMAGFRSWWTGTTGDDLRDFAKLFLDAWGDPDRRTPTRYLTHHVIAANHSSTTVEGRIMIAQAGMEYHSWVTNVLSGKRSKSQHKATTFTDHLNELLSDADIPNDIPAELSGLKQFAAQTGLPDGPSAIAKLRNKLTHPKDVEEPYKIELLVAEAWQLSMHYAELLLLFKLGYQGEYLPRIPASRWAGDRERVPWAPQTQTGHSR